METQLQILVCTYGLQGLERLARTQRPAIQGVSYLVSCQLPQASPPESKNTPGKIQATTTESKTSITSRLLSDLPANKESNRKTILSEASPTLQSFLQRPDVEYHFLHNQGLSKNRNHALRLASAPLALLSDDDLDYTEESLLQIIQAFHNHPKADVITFKCRIGNSESPKDGEKTYPEQGFNHRKPPKGYYVSSWEIAFRTEKVKGLFTFNEHFGIGAEHFPSGEEELFLKDLLNAGLHCIFLPLYIAVHPTLSTGTRNLADPRFLQTKGAVFCHIHPKTWWLRLLKESISQAHKKNVQPGTFLSNTFKGAFKARRLKVFPKED